MGTHTAGVRKHVLGPPACPSHEPEKCRVHSKSPKGFRCISDKIHPIPRVEQQQLALSGNLSTFPLWHIADVS